eukprot:TRINITY_DN101218_c0_g1_i1.p2 TRINITY_DN101218_c0_g1~~TRINITY_DN101218_c0_g1_i1.p2  ORF type:complete len:379 (-),score=117.26 TRINITY_DN101218_c0_g1_i1:258-1394(-)
MGLVPWCRSRLFRMAVVAVSLYPSAWSAAAASGQASAVSAEEASRLADLGEEKVQHGGRASDADRYVTKEQSASELESSRTHAAKQEQQENEKHDESTAQQEAAEHRKSAQQDQNMKDWQAVKDSSSFDAGELYQQKDSSAMNLNADNETASRQKQDEANKASNTEVFDAASEQRKIERRDRGAKAAEESTSQASAQTRSDALSGRGEENLFQQLGDATVLSTNDVKDSSARDLNAASTSAAQHERDEGAKQILVQESKDLAEDRKADRTDRHVKEEGQGGLEKLPQADAELLQLADDSSARHRKRQEGAEEVVDDGAPPQRRENGLKDSSPHEDEAARSQTALQEQQQTDKEAAVRSCSRDTERRKEEEKDEQEAKR